MNSYSSVAFNLEYMYASAMEYLNNRYHNHSANFHDYQLDRALYQQIAEGSSAASYAASEFTGDSTGLTVL